MTEKIEGLKEFKSLVEMITYFDTEENCLEHLKQVKWRNGAYCPHCKREKVKVYEFKDGKTYKCASCRRKFTITIGTIFEKSKIPLKKWFIAIYLITSHKKGISSHQLARDLQITQKTAWFMLHRIRSVFDEEKESKKLSGKVEVDETYLGGKEQNKHASKKTKVHKAEVQKTKTPVLGMIEREGELRIEKVQAVNRDTVLDSLLENVALNAHLNTDSFNAYNGLSEFYAKHSIINHSEKEYVRKEGNDLIHTNTVEGAFSLFKRCVIGIYHHISPKHTDYYLEMFDFRYNTRKMNEGKRFNALISKIEGKLPYKELIA